MRHKKAVYLKVKIKSLAAESKIIRREERRARDEEIRNGLTNHRRQDVRSEQRATLIAYGLMAGKAYSSIERTRLTSPSLVRVRDMLLKYSDFSPAEIQTRLEELHDAPMGRKESIPSHA